MAAAVLAGSAIVVCGWLLALSASIRARERLRARLELPRAEAPRSGSRTRFHRWLTHRAAARGWDGAPRGYGLALASGALGGLLIGWRLAGPIGGVLGMAGGPLLVEAYLSRRVAASAYRAEEQLKDAVAAVAAGVRAGLSVRRALGEAARDAEPPLRGHIEAGLAQVRVGVPLGLVLEQLSERLALPDGRLLVTALHVYGRSGGDLPVLLDEVSAIIGQRLESRRQVRALTAQGRASGAVLAVLPIAFVALLSWTGGDGLGAFYRTPLGAGLLLGGLMCDLLGFLWIRRIIRVGNAAQ